LFIQWNILYLDTLHIAMHS